MIDNRTSKRTRNQVPRVSMVEADKGNHLLESGTNGRPTAEWLRKLCLEVGADDVGFVNIDRPEVADQRDDILTAFPRTKTLIAYLVRMNREPLKSTARSIANMEFHHAGDEVNEVGRRIVGALEREGIGALNPPMGFPMEMDRFPGKVWMVSHKPVAQAAGLGKIGIHRNIIHPKFGNFVLLGTILTDLEVSKESNPIDYNPCLECKLCVAACPVGAIEPDGQFNFSACYTHNYREFMGGFTDWVENVVDSDNSVEYRNRVNDSESASMWQSLSFGANYKAAYCLSVCPAGEDVIGPYLEDRKKFVGEVVKPFQKKEETVYVLAGSDAEEHVEKRFRMKKVKRVRNSLRPNSIRGFLDGMRLTFQRGQCAGLDAVYHFSFTGNESEEATVIIRNKSLQVLEGHVGTPDLRIAADSRSWLRFLSKEVGIFWLLIRRKIRLKGSPKLLLAFGRCFPS